VSVLARLPGAPIWAGGNRVTSNSALAPPRWRTGGAACRSSAWASRSQRPRCRPPDAGAQASVSHFPLDIPWGGRAVAIAVAPGMPGVAIVASESGGLFRTRDGGQPYRMVSVLALSRTSLLVDGAPRQRCG
jgi:hypothetical protein